MKHDVFLNGKTVDLVVLELKHVKKTDWYKWLNNQKLTTYTKQGYFPNTKEKQLKYFLDNLHKKKELNKKTNKFVGVISLFRFDYFSRCCEISILINFEKLNNSMKVYKEAQDLLIKHAFFKMNFRRIQTSTFSSELSDLAIRLFGFKLEGIQKEREYVNGKYHDLYLLGLLKNYYVSN